MQQLDYAATLTVWTSWARVPEKTEPRNHDLEEMTQEQDKRRTHLLSSCFLCLPSTMAVRLRVWSRKATKQCLLAWDRTGVETLLLEQDLPHFLKRSVLSLQSHQMMDRMLLHESGMQHTCQIQTLAPNGLLYLRQGGIHQRQEGFLTINHHIDLFTLPILNDGLPFICPDEMHRFHLDGSIDLEIDFDPPLCGSTDSLLQLGESAWKDIDDSNRATPSQHPPAPLEDEGRGLNLIDASI